MKLKLGISPCPNDTFVFDSLINKEIQIPDVEIETFFEDIETLNNHAEQELYDVTKLSFNAFFNHSDKYKMLSVGAAMVYGTGPLLVSKEKTDIKSLENKLIAIPGKNTTANLLLRLCTDINYKTVEIIFSEIEDAILNNRVDAGVIIHENRFTYKQKGLTKVLDLGTEWFNITKLPVPLGLIAVHNRVDRKLVDNITQSIKNSIIKSRERNLISDFIISHAQAMDSSVMQKHINLFVNDFTYELSEEGKDAIIKMSKIAYDKGVTKNYSTDIFV